MKCMNCGGDTYTIYTWEREGAYVRRRKVCQTCGLRFATYEFTDEVVQDVIGLLDGRKHLIIQIREQLPKFYPKNGKCVGRKGEQKTADDHF